jgi:hypothetical protein
VFIILGAEDPRCPVAGLEIPTAKASQAYKKFDRVDNFQVCTHISTLLRNLTPAKCGLHHKFERKKKA